MSYPVVGETVIGNIREMSEAGIYVTLLEYEGLEGFAQTSELYKKREKKKLNIAQNEVFSVCAVNIDKNYIDLTRKRVNSDDKEKFLEGYNVRKRIKSCLISVANKLGIEFDDVKEKVRKEIKDREETTSVLNAAQSDEEFERIFGEMETVLKGTLRSEINKRFRDNKKTYECYIEVSCTGVDGVNTIRTVLSGIKESEKDVEFVVKCISPPLYLLRITSEDEKEAISFLNEKLERIGIEIEKYEGGSAFVKSPPKCMNEDERNTMREMMEKEYE